MTPNIQIAKNHASPASATFHIYFVKTGKDNLSQLPVDLHKSVRIKGQREEFEGKKTELVHMERITEAGTEHVVVVGLGSAGYTPDIIRNQTVQAVQLARRVKATEIVIYANDYEKNLRAIAEGIYMGDYSFDTFKSKESLKKHPHVQNALIISEDTKKNKELVRQGIHAASAVLFARDMVNTPASHLHPETLIAYAQDIEKKSQGLVTVKILSEKECERLGMGAFLGVAQGSDRNPAFIVLHYKGKGERKFALVGKSITFDSGGLSLKPSDSMMDMKIDMAGGAAVLGVFDYLATQKPQVKAFSDIYGILPACENMPSGKAIKPGDIVTAMNGKTIEVLNTDAEGRLALADALVYAEKELRADYIVDMATLTGACMVALGSDLAGLFSNDERFVKAFGETATDAGDGYWQMPLHEAYLPQIKSKIADLKNIGGGRYGGAITAALFLKEFVEKAKWMHIDIAGPAHTEKNGASGWGVLPVIYFLEHITNV